MKALCISVFFVLLCGLLFSPVSFQADQTHNEASLSAILNSRSIDHYKMIPGSIYQVDDWIHLRSYYTIYNIGISDITLGPVYVFEDDGLSGNPTIWDDPYPSGLNGKVIPPLGSICFQIEQTGVPPVTNQPGSPRGAFVTVVTWSGGSENSLRLTGVTTTFDSVGNIVTSVSIEPF